MPMGQRTVPWFPETSPTHSAASCSSPTSCLDFLWGSGAALRSRSAQDMRPGALGVSRTGWPGSSQAWRQESPGHRAQLHPDPTDNTHIYIRGQPCQFHCTSPRGQRSLFTLWGPAYPPIGF